MNKGSLQFAPKNLMVKIYQIVSSKETSLERYRKFKKKEEKIPKCP